MKYLFGDEVKYEYDLVKPEDDDKLQAFSCLIGKTAYGVLLN